MFKVFGKWSTDGIEIRDPGLARYICLKPLYVPHTHARHANKPFAKARVHVVERLINKLMRGGTGGKLKGKVIRTHGRTQGKKLKVMKIVERAFEIIERRTGQNPIQVLIRAIENAAPREETTRVEYGGVIYQIAVDCAPMRRLDLALQNIALATVMSAFNNKKKAYEALAEEIILAANNDNRSYAIQRKDEIERIARSAR